MFVKGVVRKWVIETLTSCCLSFFLSERDGLFSFCLNEQLNSVCEGESHPKVLLFLVANK